MYFNIMPFLIFLLLLGLGLGILITKVWPYIGMIAHCIVNFLW